MTATGPPGVWGIDAGGSRTTAVVVVSGAEFRRDFPTISVGTVGSESAATVLATVLDFVRSRLAPGAPAFGCIGWSSMPVARESPYPGVLVEVIESRAPAGIAVVANDMVPLLYSPPIAGEGIVISSGTGSCVLGRSESGQLAKIGGHEHIVSDAGSAYSLGRAALRAAAAAHDGTGAPTKLLERVVEHFGMTIPVLGRALAEQRSARAAVAGFAPVLLDSDDDAVAHHIIDANAASLADAARLAIARLSLPIQLRIGFSGGVMRGSPSYRALVSQKLGEHGRRARTFVLDGPEAVRSIAVRLREQGSAESAAVGDRPFPGPDEALFLNVQV